LKYERKISEAVIKRLPRYYRYLEDLLNMGISRVSSKDLSTRTGLTSSQVRQDFYCFGGFGLQGYGYDVEFLHNEIKKILGLDTTFKMIIIGAGNLGQALTKHIPLEKKGFKVVGIFDVNPALFGVKVGDLEIMNINEVTDFVKANQVDIAAITVPAVHARETAALTIYLGIKGVWNFAPVELKVPPLIALENNHLTDSLMTLGYKINNSK